MPKRSGPSFHANNGIPFELNSAKDVIANDSFFELLENGEPVPREALGIPDNNSQSIERDPGDGRKLHGIHHQAMVCSRYRCKCAFR